MAVRSLARPLLGASRRASSSAPSVPRAWASTSTSSWSTPSIIPPKPVPAATTQAAKPTPSNAPYKTPTPVKPSIKAPVEALPPKDPVAAVAAAEAPSEAPAKADSEAPAEASLAEATSSSAPTDASPATPNDIPFDSSIAVAPTDETAEAATAEPPSDAPPAATPASSSYTIKRTPIQNTTSDKTSSNTNTGTNSSGYNGSSYKIYPSNNKGYKSYNKTSPATTPAPATPASTPVVPKPASKGPAPAPAAELHDPSAYASTPLEPPPAVERRKTPTLTTEERSFVKALAATPPKSAERPKNEIDWVRSFHGISEQPFSERAADILSRPLNIADIEVKPDGIVYLPEIKYRRILNAAFGPGGWAMVPRGDPVVRERIVTREYALIVGGRFISQAQGESTFFSAESVPASVEACKSNALMRCCKDIGIASELWDPVFIRAFRKKHAEQVWCEHVVNKTKRQLWTKMGVPIGYPFKRI